jgi:polygalacturonase
MRHHPPVSIRRLATGLVAVPALLLSALAVPSLVASASPEAATTAQDMVATAVTSAQPAIGDPRDVTQPRLPAVACATLPAQLPGGTRIFSAADEAAPPDTARIQAALDSCPGSGGSVVLAPASSAPGLPDNQDRLLLSQLERLAGDPGVVLRRAEDGC